MRTLRGALFRLCRFLSRSVQRRPILAILCHQSALRMSSGALRPGTRQSKIPARAVAFVLMSSHTCLVLRLGVWFLRSARNASSLGRVKRAFRAQQAAQCRGVPSAALRGPVDAPGAEAEAHPPHPVPGTRRRAPGSERPIARDVARALRRPPMFGVGGCRRDVMPAVRSTGRMSGSRRVDPRRLACEVPSPATPIASRIVCCGSFGAGYLGTPRKTPCGRRSRSAGGLGLSPVDQAVSAATPPRLPCLAGDLAPSGHQRRQMAAGLCSRARRCSRGGRRPASRCGALLAIHSGRELSLSPASLHNPVAFAPCSGSVSGSVC